MGIRASRKPVSLVRMGNRGVTSLLPDERLVLGHRPAAAPLPADWIFSFPRNRSARRHLKPGANWTFDESKSPSDGLASKPHLAVGGRGRGTPAAHRIARAHEVYGSAQPRPRPSGRGAPESGACWESPSPASTAMGDGLRGRATADRGAGARGGRPTGELRKRGTGVAASCRPQKDEVLPRDPRRRPTAPAPRLSQHISATPSVGHVNADGRWETTSSRRAIRGTRCGSRLRHRGLGADYACARRATAPSPGSIIAARGMGTMSLAPHSET